MREWDVVVCDIVKEVDFGFIEQETRSDRVDWCITPSFVEETAVFVECFEEVDVGF